MKLRNGKIFPADYLLKNAPPLQGDEAANIRRYYVPEDPPASPPRLARWKYVSDAGRWRSEYLEHDPAYRALVDAISFYDLTIAQDRIEFISLITLALFLDPWNYASSVAMRTTDNMGKVNAMDELEEFNRRLVSCEAAVKILRQVSDDPDLAIMDARDAGTQANMRRLSPPAPPAPPPKAEE